MIRHFICQKGNSDKFWTIQVTGNTIITTYGKNNSYTEPKSTKNEYPTSEKCLQEADKLIAAKLKDDYEEVLLNFPGVPVYILKIVQDSIENKVEKLHVDTYNSEGLLKVICTIIGLKDLELYNVKIIPPEIGNLQNLIDFSIKNSQELKNIPKEFGLLKKLKRLEIEGTGLEQLPDEIGNFQNLEDLRISNNRKLKSLPQSIGLLINLDDAYIQGNGGEKIELGIPKEIGNLKKIVRLQLPSNNLKSIPAEIGKLKTLTELDLNFNHIKELPKEIYNLENLETLELSYNQLTVLPKELVQLKNLSDISLENNPIKNIPEDILYEGIEAIVDFLSGSEKLANQKIASPVSQDLIEQNQKKYKEKIEAFIRTSKSKIYKPTTLKMLDEIISFLSGKTNEVPMAKTEDEYYFESIMDVFSPFKEWTFVDRRILDYITQDAWSFKKDKDGFYDSFYRWFAKEISKNDYDGFYNDVIQEIKARGIKEELILKHSLSELDDHLLNTSRGATSFGQYLISNMNSMMNAIISIAKEKTHIKDCLIELFLKYKEKEFEPFLPELVVMDNYEGSDGSNHAPYSLLETLCKINKTKYEHYLNEFLPQTDCKSCSAEMGRIMKEFYSDKYNNVVFEIAQNTLKHISTKRNKKGDDRYEFYWSQAERWTDGTPQYIDWILTSFGKQAQEIIFKYVSDTKILDLEVIRVVVKHLGQDAVDIASEALNMTITGNDIAAHFRKLFPILSGLDFSKYHDKVWEIAKSEFKQVRQTACLALCKLDTKIVTPKAIELLDSKKSHEREAGILILSLINNDESIQILKSLLDSEKNDDARDIIVECIYKNEQSISIEDVDNRVKSAAKRGKLDKPVAKWLDEHSLPKIKWNTGKEIESDTIRFLLHRQTRQKEIICDYESNAIYTLIDKKSSGEFALTLLNLILKNGGAKAQNRFALSVVGMLGDSSIIPVLKDLAIKTMNENACATLGLNISLDAARALNKIIQFFRIKYPNVKNAANEGFNAIAGKMGLTAFELSDKMLPDFGFVHLARTFNSDNQTYTVQIDSNFKLEYKDANNKIIKSLPKGVSPQLTAEFKDLGSQIKEAVKQLKINLEYYLVIQRKWIKDDWENYFLTNALAFSFARNFVWATFEKNKLVSTFNVNDDTSFSNTKGELIQLSPNTGIGLVHPLDLTDQERKVWMNVLSKNNLKPPFCQIDRPVYTVSPQEANKSISFMFDETELNGLTFKSRAEKLGWHRGSVIDSGEVSSYRKAFENKQIEVFIKTSGMGVQFYDDNMTLGEFFFVKLGSVVTGSYTYDEPRNENDDRLIKFSDVPKIVYSETLADLYNITKSDEKEEE